MEKKESIKKENENEKENNKKIGNKSKKYYSLPIESDIFSYKENEEIEDEIFSILTHIQPKFSRVYIHKNKILPENKVEEKLCYDYSLFKKDEKEQKRKSIQKF